MNRASVADMIEKMKSDYDYKTITGASFSMLVVLAFALYNGFLGIYHSSLWYGTICIYYIILVIIRGSVIAGEKKASVSADGDRIRNRVYVGSSLMIILLNIALITPISLMVKQQKPVNMTLIPAIAMACYTTYKIIMASVNLKRRKQSADILVRLLRSISFIDALVSVLTLQNTLIMVSSGGHDASMFAVTALSSAVIWFMILILSVSSLPCSISILINREL